MTKEFNPTTYVLLKHIARVMRDTFLSAVLSLELFTVRWEQQAGMR